MSGTLPTVPGRSELLAFLWDAVESARAGQSKLALLIINLRGFRVFNATFGHARGDMLLVEVQSRLSESLRSDAKLFHVGNDEFAVVITHLKTSGVVQLAALKLLESIERDCVIDGVDTKVSALVGAAIFPLHANSLEDLMRVADGAVSLARKKGESFCLYQDELSADNRQNIKIENSLHSALKRDELSMHYQPQVDLQNSRVPSCEALIRWKEKVMGWVSPEKFIQIAEKSGLIDDLTYWTLNVALRECLEWFDLGGQRSVSMNLSQRLLHSRELVALVSRAISIWGVNPQFLVLEVTETAMMADAEAALANLNKLREMGVRLSIDDFGTGFSSLAYLKKLPVIELKIDQSFVRNMAISEHDRAIVSSVIELAHGFGISVVAEGIENQQCMELLADMGCDKGQGYYIARPMPARELSDWVKKHQRLDTL